MRLPVFTVFLIAIAFFSSLAFGQQMSKEKIELIKIYQENFSRLNTANSCPNDLKSIRKAFLKKAGKMTLVASHRGDHMEAPENSLLAFEHSIAFGTSIVELDVRNSSDDSLMVIHDGTVDRTTNGSGQVEEMSYMQLKSLNLLNDYTQEISLSRMPTLFESLSKLKGKVMIDLDIKCDKIAEIYEAVDRLDMFRQVLFFCDESDMDFVLARNPKAMVMPRARSMEELDHLLEKYNPKIVHIDDSNFDIPAAVALIRRKSPKCRVWANTLGKRDQMAIQGDDSGVLELAKLGVDVIQTDLPRYVGSLVCTGK